jgi:tetratricopeptide (TPR) repeat protein
MPPSRLRHLAPVLLLVGVTVAAHAGGLGNGFAWDDKLIIVENPDTRDLSQLKKVVLSPDVMKPYYRPLCRASYLLDYQLYGMEPAGFHAENLLLHLAGVLLLFALGLRLFQQTAPALLAAMLLAVHPIHVEAVAFISARNNLLALLFSLGATLLLMRAVEKRSTAAAVLSGLAYFLGLASKEQGAMVLPVLGAWLLIAPASRPLRLRGLPFLVPHLVALAAYLALRSVALGGPGEAGAIWPGLAGRLLRNYFLIPAYLRLVAFPDRLSILHELPGDDLTLWWLPLTWLLLIGLVVYLIRRPSPAGTFGLLWCGLNLVPVLGFVPIPSTGDTAMAERFIHASAAGAWLVVAELAFRAAHRLPRRVAWAGAATLIFALGARSWSRTQDWKDDLALRRSVVKAAPRSLMARFDLGVELKDQGDLEGARAEWLAALSIAPRDPGTQAQLGTLAAVEGRLDEAEERYRVALAGDPGLAEASLNLGKICDRTSRRAEAAGHYGAVIDNPRAGAELVAQARAALARLGAGP